ncbi:MAG: RNA methyltransferase [Pseudomonadota bacterium]|nr:RNA methyltransferase [Pseudomonadota bacterium]
MTSNPLERLDRVYVALVETQMPENIGSAARAMKAMGLSRLVLVAPQAFPHDRANALAAGADDVLAAAKVCASVTEGLGECGFVLGCTARSRSVSMPMLTPRESAQRLIEAAERGPVAIMFGSERVGLSNADLSRCDAAVHIPTDAAFSSLNVAQAVQVLAYELRLAALACTHLESKGSVLAQLPQTGSSQTGSPQTETSQSQDMDTAATLAEMEGYFAHLEQTLADIDFLKGRSARIIMQRLRRLYLRAVPSQREVQILRGILSDAQRQATLARHSR